MGRVEGNLMAAIGSLQLYISVAWEYNMNMKRYWPVFAALLIVGIVMVTVFVVRKKEANSSRGTLSGIHTLPPDNSSSASSSTNDAIATGDYFLEIKNVGIAAPVILDVDGNNTEAYMRALESGVAHMRKTALPGQSGNAVIFGHSSYYANKPGSFKEIFASLEKLAVGDRIEIKNGDSSYVYRVFEEKVVDPLDVSVVAQDQNKKMLTLITCWPVETTTSRYIVTAVMED